MDKNQHEQTIKELNLILMLYRQKLVGDKYIDLNKIDISQNIQYNAIRNDATRENNQTSNNLEQKVSQCKLCSLSNMVKDTDRFCGVVPTKFEFVDNRNTTKKIFPKIAFIVESLRIKSDKNIPNNTIEKLEYNKNNNMIFDIAQKVFFIKKESIFLFPLFKCVDTDTNQYSNKDINTQIQTQPLDTQRNICIDYLYSQLETIDYAIFFGENICVKLFETTLQETRGKLLDYYAPSGKKIICVCVPDTMQMLIDSKLKKEALINFVLLKNVIDANSC